MRVCEKYFAALDESFPEHEDNGSLDFIDFSPSVINVFTCEYNAEKFKDETANGN